MNAKKFIISGFLGGFADFLLGSLFYGILFKDIYPNSNNMLLIALGCFTYGFFVSYIFNRWAGISVLTSGLKAGAVIGLFYGLLTNFFMFSSKSLDYNLFIKDVLISIVVSAIVGLVVAFSNGKIK